MFTTDDSDAQLSRGYMGGPGQDVVYSDNRIGNTATKQLSNSVTAAGTNDTP